MISKIKYHYPTHSVKLFNNIEICYMDEGKGKQTLLFIHGMAYYGNVWFQQIEELKQHYRCIAIDLPGCGLSSRGDYHYSMLFFSEVIAKFCAKLQLDEIILCGHSMGGHVGIVTALRYPPLVKQLIAIAPSGFEQFAPAEIAIYKGMLSFGNFFISNQMQLTTSLQQSFYKMPASGKKMIDDLVAILNSDDLNHWRNMVDKCIEGMLNEQVFHLLKFIQCPVLAIFGNHDTLIPNVFIHPSSTLQVATMACKEIYNSKLVMIAEAGHAVFMEQPGEVNAEIKKFIEGN
ncbi:MAG: alpha/beta hydrolase [Bacteroidia bacterium]